MIILIFLTNSLCRYPYTGTHPRTPTRKINRRFFQIAQPTLHCTIIHYRSSLSAADSSRRFLRVTCRVTLACVALRAIKSETSVYYFSFFYFCSFYYFFFIKTKKNYKKTLYHNKLKSIN